ncbi:transcription factor HIVEP3 [Eucyclogobius newberryi]|uniref:transcription factor HIVEP3 n=1 Tax=Eucyclogobius newberryi TaxID=166745 RepID=UPI003B59B73C
MEALSSSLTTGEQSGGQEHSEEVSHHQLTQSPSANTISKQQQSDSSKGSHGAPQQSKQSKRPLSERKRLRAQRQSIDSDTIPEHNQKETKTVSENSPGGNPSKAETQEGTPKQKRERKPQKPGKYVCTYCGRACAKPSVLQKHIRSHTGERPYPCPPCGFSFKTKSNLYKHRKSHTHRVKAGLALGDARPSEEQITESEDEARHPPSASSIPSVKILETNQVKDTTAMDNSYAVKKRLAMRLSRGRVETPKNSTDDNNLSLILGSKESTESGYFSRSESTEQDPYPNTSAKSYAEIILGKYGRLGHLQRMSRQNNQQSPSEEDKSVSFTVPKKQVIDHITKLITINEAVVDTSKIDSVKPRRFSLSRKNSDPQKSSPPKEPLLEATNPAELLNKSSGSITMGVPCEKFQHHSSNVQLPGQTSAPLLRSHSMPTGASSTNVSSMGANKFRLSQSFDERQPSETPVPRRYGMLRRQPAIDGESEGCHSFFSDCLTTVPDHKQSQPQPYECETCNTGCKNWEGYKKHKQTVCLLHRPRNEVVISQMECSQIITQSARPGALALRKRRKAESFELEDPASPTAVSSGPSSGQCNFTSNVGHEIPKRPTQTCSVIQHTSSFEKQESISDCQSTEPTNDPPNLRDPDILQKQLELSGKVMSRKLVCQHSVQVPEILVTEDSRTNLDNLPEVTSTAAKPLERSEEFQWPQRSSSLAQLPIEKLPPKKKRLRLAEAAQSSGESSFESISLPHSPSQDSSASYASSRSTSFEESNRLESETLTSPSLRRSRALHMLTVPGIHPHREMRRSASEQAPHDPQPQNVTMSETRSKSFDYSSLSPERSALGWRERRKCLLIRHTAVKDPDEEDPSSSAHNSEKVIFSPLTSSVFCGKSPDSALQGETISQYSKSIEIVHQWKQQNVQLKHSSEQLNKVGGFDNPLKEEALKVCTDPLPAPTPNPTSTHGLSGAARAHYLPVSTGLKLQIPSGPRYSHSHMQHSSAPQIVSSVERVRPITSTAVVVRFQAQTLTPACAIYTTLSQSTSPRPLDALDAAISHTRNQSAVKCLDYRRASPEHTAWSGELRASSSGGNKRMLSPSNSIELSPESQQQQKRVKEDEAHNIQELKPEPPSCQTSEFPPVSQVESSYPTLLSSTCNSWCYLNYVKPNPAAHDEQKPSVYSSWSTGGYDPNPPGLSSKTALSLLHCKQRLSPTIYTTSSMSARTDEAKKEQRPRSPEINLKTTGICNSNEHQSVTTDNSDKPVEEKKMVEETWMAKTRSDETCTGAGESQVNHKDCSVLPESPQDCAQAPPPHSTQPSAAVKAEESHRKHTSLTAAEQTSFSGDTNTGKTRLSELSQLKSDVWNHFGFKKTKDKEPDKTKVITEAIATFVCKDLGPYSVVQNERFKRLVHALDPHYVMVQLPCPPDPPKPLHNNTNVQGIDTDKPAQPDTSITKDSDTRCDEEKGPSTASALTPNPAPSDSTQRTWASVRRALFARRRVQPTGLCTPPGGSPQPPEKEPSSPPRSPVCVSVPTSACSSPGCLVSTSSEASENPMCLLTTRVTQSPKAGSSGSQSSQANARDVLDCAAQSKVSPSPRELAVPHAAPHPSRGRPAPNLLSHLPLHSQRTARSPSLLIPIGGIHMIQSRPSSSSSSSSFRLRSSTGTGALCKLIDTPLLAQHPPSPPSTPPAENPPTSTEIQKVNCL